MPVLKGRSEKQDIKKITHPSQNCKSWGKRDFKNICEELTECPNCSSIHSLELKSTDYVWRWDITLPKDWRYGDWESIKLTPEYVPLPVMSCNVCNKPVRVIPAFIIRGTTLTLPALVFVAFAYESSALFLHLTWRDIPVKFCTEDNRIAHSTLYKAVHGMGKLLLEDEEAQKLGNKYMGFLTDISGSGSTEIVGWSKEKSLRPHTKERERAVRIALTALLITALINTGTIHEFTRYLDRAHLFFMKLDRPLARLYKYKKGEVIYINSS